MDRGRRFATDKAGYAAMRKHVAAWPDRVWTYDRRKLAAGKTRMEATRCLKRRISDAVYRQLVTDARRANRPDDEVKGDAGPGGHCGASQEFSAVDLPSHIDTSDQPLPGPAKPTLQPPKMVRKNSARKALQTTG